MPTSTKPAVPSTGLPPGVEAAPLGKRFVAQLIDISVPLVVGSIMAAVNGALDGGGAATVVSVLGSLLIAGWLLLVWWMFATRAAGPGMRAMKLQLVGLRDGRPIGWGRFLARSLVLLALTATVIGLLVMLVVLVGQRRRQGWHDLAANAVVIKERVLAPRKRPSTGSPAPAAALGPQAVPPSTETPADASRGQAVSSGRAQGPGQSPGPGQARPERAQPSGPQPDRPAQGQGQPAQGQPAQGQPAARTGVGGPGQPPSGPEQGRGAVPGGQPGSGDEPPARVAESIRRTPHGSVPLSAVPDADGRGQPAQRRAHRPLDQGWYVALDDGRTIDVPGLMLLGRNPQARPGEEDADLIKVADDTRTVSKTHLSLSVDASGLFVMDRGSTNGTTLTAPGRDSRYCLAGEVVPVEPGSIVSFGDHWLKLEQRAEG
jgi:uncharacterized RDD family membrane protein YckC